MLKSLLLFGVATGLCAVAFAQVTSRWEQGNIYAHNSYRYKSIGFQNLVVQVADVPPLRYGVREFAAFSIIVLNEDKKRRVVNWIRIGFPVTVAAEGGFISSALQEGHPRESPSVRGKRYSSVDQLQRDCAVRWKLWSHGHAPDYNSAVRSVTFHYLF